LRLLPNSLDNHFFCVIIWFVKKLIRKQGQILKRLNGLAPYIIQGSLVTLKSPCGKINCACAQNPDKRHPRHYLSFSESGRTQMVYIPVKKLNKFREGAKAWTEFKKLTKQLAQVNSQLAKSKEERSS